MKNIPPGVDFALLGVLGVPFFGVGVLTFIVPRCFGSVSKYLPASLIDCFFCSFASYVSFAMSYVS